MGAFCLSLRLQRAITSGGKLGKAAPEVGDLLFSSMALDGLGGGWESLTHSFNKYLLSAYSVLGTILDTRHCANIYTKLVQYGFSARNLNLA